MFIHILPLLVGTFLNIISSAKVSERAEHLLINPYSPLPDIIHSNIPPIPVVIPDYFLFISICIGLFNYKYLINFEKNLVCIELCSIIRSFSIWFTIMPTCMPQPVSNSIDNIKKLNKIGKLTYLYKKCFHSTHDLMFSGHTLFFIFIGNILNNNFIKVVGPCLLVISRQHYTIDVCVAGLVYSFIYSHSDSNINLFF
jgi:hypothetical protein